MENRLQGESKMSGLSRRRYSVLEYRQFFDEFTQEYPNYRKNIFRPLFFEEDLFTMNVDEMKYFLVDKVCANSRSLKYMQDNRNILSKFFGWCEKRGIIPFNVFESQEYALSVFLEYMVEKMHTVPIFEEEIREVVLGLDQDQALAEVLIRGFFEGIESIADFVRLQAQEVDFEQETILYRGQKRKMSEAFFHALKIYRENLKKDACTKNRGEWKYLLFYLSKGGRGEFDEEKYLRNQAKNIKRFLEKISRLSACELMPERLFVSGFLHFVKKKCREEGRDDVYFVRIFRCGYNTQYYKWIEIYAKEYGMAGKIYPEKLRLRCYPYVLNYK